ncbi:uncharacterized protein BDR25DRAFT_361757 [Lindgomyces ingoldianus]|uniref:Uncharacterized protein n=1 Tax=Lindgomyces ingoldianus TaxID=673940 RepID=A0ACB6QBG9_9PLEO|nr:uncharacterized protein BDR25DRAFT_361757 [Lindgomyces ingoldianus]KAF2464251.1 hypothetical protein BDR25DRAFT_361757 [Lindgomyces ingoldianus]
MQSWEECEKASTGPVQGVYIVTPGNGRSRPNFDLVSSIVTAVNGNETIACLPHAAFIPHTARGQWRWLHIRATNSFDSHTACNGTRHRACGRLFRRPGHLVGSQEADHTRRGNYGKHPSGGATIIRCHSRTPRWPRIASCTDTIQKRRLKEADGVEMRTLSEDSLAQSVQSALPLSVILQPPHLIPPRKSCTRRLFNPCHPDQYHLFSISFLQLQVAEKANLPIAETEPFHQYRRSQIVPPDIAPRAEAESTSYRGRVKRIALAYDDSENPLLNIFPKMCSINSTLPFIPTFRILPPHTAETLISTTLELPSVSGMTIFYILFLSQLQSPAPLDFLERFPNESMDPAYNHSTIRLDETRPQVWNPCYLLTRLSGSTLRRSLENVCRDLIFATSNSNLTRTPLNLFPHSPQIFPITKFTESTIEISQALRLPPVRNISPVIPVSSHVIRHTSLALLYRKVSPRVQMQMQMQVPYIVVLTCFLHETIPATRNVERSPMIDHVLTSRVLWLSGVTYDIPCFGSGTSSPLYRTPIRRRALEHLILEAHHDPDYQEHGGQAGGSDLKNIVSISGPPGSRWWIYPLELPSPMGWATTRTSDDPFCPEENGGPRQRPGSRRHNLPSPEAGACYCKGPEDLDAGWGGVSGQIRGCIEVILCLGAEVKSQIFYLHFAILFNWISSDLSTMSMIYHAFNMYA